MFSSFECSALFNGFSSAGQSLCGPWHVAFLNIGGPLDEVFKIFDPAVTLQVLSLMWHPVPQVSEETCSVV